MSDERKIENKTVNYSVNWEIQTYVNETKRKRHNLVTESCRAESERRGK